MWRDDKGEFGFQVTTKTRETLLAIMEEVIRTNVIKINSERTVDELLTFIMTDNNKIEADVGKHDDLISSLALASYGLNNLVDTTPLEQSKIPHKEKKPQMLQGRYLRIITVFAGVVDLTQYSKLTSKDLKIKK